VIRRFSPWATAVAIAVFTGAACGNPNGPDNGGNNGGGSNPPTITCPTSPSPLTSPNGQPVNVQYGTPIATGTGVSTNCSPVSGASFPIGSTAVVCTATDASGRSAACSFTITVQSAPRISLTRFAAFGDSITWGEDGTDFCTSTFVADSTAGRIRPHKQMPAAQRYPTVLQGLLQARYPAQAITVDGWGVSGEQAGASTTWTRFTNQVVNPHTYDAVLLMEGANDVNAQTPNNGITGLQQMLHLAKGGGVRPFLATIPPEIEGRYYSLSSAAVRSFNNSVRSLAAFENVTLVDVETAFGATPGNYISCDGLHPNAEGYRIIANSFFNVLVQTLQTSALSTQSTSGLTTSAIPAPARPRSPVRPRP
jgi:lysophospholipase L1-like esterase